MEKSQLLMAFNQQICFEGMIYNKQIHDIQMMTLKYLEVSERFNFSCNFVHKFNLLAKLRAAAPQEVNTFSPGS